MNSTRPARPILAALGIALSVSASAAPSPQECEAIGKASENYSRSMSGLLDATQRRNAGAVANETTGEMKASVYKFEEARQRLIPALAEMVKASDNMALQFKRCGPR